MKRFVFLLVCVLLFILGLSVVNATEDEAKYFYTNESGELVGSNEYDLDDDAVLIDNQEDLDSLYENSNNNENEEIQEELEKSFIEQAKELKIYKEQESDKKFVITKVISNIKSQYIDDYNYVYIVKYQVVNIRTQDDKETSAVIILSYDVSDNKNIKPVKEGDTLYGYVEYVSQNDSMYNMVDHGLKDEEIALVSISNQDRSLGVILLLAFTLLLLILYAGKNGAKFLIPIFIALDLLFIVLVPELEIGRNMFLLVCMISFELMVLITVLKNGWSRKTVVALISSIIVVVLVATLGILFGNANGFTGKGIITEEKYDLLSNVYYIDTVFKTTINMFDLYISMIILISSIITSIISSKIVDLAEKYAGTDGMINSIIEESKLIISEYPLVLASIFMTMFIPNFMIEKYNHSSYETMVNSESFVTTLAVGLIVIISSLITSPICAIVSYLFMGKVEVKQISESK